MSTGLLPQTEAIRLYCGCGEQKWNGVPVEVGPYACVSPVYGKTLATKSPTYVRLSQATVAVIQDSGAFCDAVGQRLSFEAALRRQVEHAERFEYASRLTHRATYDLLVDEKWSNTGVRVKKRWSASEAWEACLETIRAAKFLSRHRESLHGIFSVQGVEASQYLSCVQGVLPYMQDGDMLGLGGFCILGLMPRQTMPAFREIIHTVIPFIATEGIAHVHLWGCLYAPALGELLWLCDRYGVTVSTDSVYPSLRPVLGKWGYGGWADRHYRRPANGPELGRQRVEHVALVRAWLNDFRQREPRHYRFRPLRTQQSLFGDDNREAFPTLHTVDDAGEVRAGKEEKEQDAHEYFRAPRRKRMGRVDSA